MGVSAEDDWEEVSDARAAALASVLGPGDGMVFHAPIKAFLFDTYATFTLFDHECELRLLLGITKQELQFKLDHGPEQLLKRLKRHGVYPYTDLGRDSVPLDAD